MREGVERLLVNGFEYHDHGPLKHLVLRRRYSDGTGFPVFLRYMDPFDRRCVIGSTLGSFQQPIEIALKVLAIVLYCLSVYSRRTVLAQPFVGFL